MADELLRSRHAFGSSENIASAIDQNLIDAYDILFLDGDTEPKLGWIDKDGAVRIVDNECVVVVDDGSLPEVGESGKIYIFDSKFYFWNGSKYVTPIDETGIGEAEVDKKIDTAVTNVVNETNSYTDEKIEIVDEVTEKIKYEIVSKPVGTLVDYGEKEIRVMCPANTVWTKQEVGNTGNPNMYYMGFKAYAPENAVSFKEGDRGVIVDEMFTFDGDFSGVDKYGRKYSICWLALASYDETTNTWNYFGKNSTHSKYIGWTYVVEWYDANGVIIAFDSIRINLSNENCHSSIEPYYISDAIVESKTYTDEQIKEKLAALSAFEIVEF